VVSYSIPLCALTESKVENVLLPNSPAASEVVARGCEGTEREAAAQPGHLCVFSSELGPGGREAVWKNAKFVQFDEPDGIVSLTSGVQGVLLVFQTKGFNSAATATIAPGGAYLVAGGPWAVTAP
jgi:hypothetical protein